MKSILRSCLLLGCSLFLAASPAPAATITPLNTTSWPTGWTTAAQGTTSVAVTSVNETDYLKVERTANNGIGAITFWNGDETITDGWFNISYSGSVLVRTVVSSSPVGVTVGAQSKTYTNNVSTNYRGYYIAMIPNAGLGIWYNDLTGTGPSSSNVLTNAWAPVTDALASNTDYRLDFAVSGAVLSASLWAVDANGQKTGSAALLTVGYTAENPIQGYFGLKGGRLGNNTSVYLRDVEITTIPEPSSVILPALGGLVLLTTYRRRKK